MANFLDRIQPQLYAIFRIVLGFLFLWHGMSKLFGFPGGSHEAPAYITYVAGPIELVGGILVMMGLFSRWAAFVCSGLMAAAYWMAHGMTSVLPYTNDGEMAVLYCFAFLLISSHGSGIWSADAARSGA